MKALYMRDTSGKTVVFGSLETLVKDKWVVMTADAGPAVMVDKKDRLRLVVFDKRAAAEKWAGKISNVPREDCAAGDLSVSLVDEDLLPRVAKAGYACDRVVVVEKGRAYPAIELLPADEPSGGPE